MTTTETTEILIKRLSHQPVTGHHMDTSGPYGCYDCDGSGLEDALSRTRRIQGADPALIGIAEKVAELPDERVSLDPADPVTDELIEAVPATVYLGEGLRTLEVVLYPDKIEYARAKLEHALYAHADDLHSGRVTLTLAGFSQGRRTV